MSLTVQNLRAVGTGIEPTSLLPGQIAFNITDKVLYVGDGSNFKTAFDGTQVAGVPGEGWYAMPMDFDSLGDYYVANPGYWGDVPTDQQVLTWSTALNHPIWTNGGAGGGNQVYVVTNAQVASATGSTTSDKISAAIGVVSPDEGNVTIVTGIPDDVYEGLYFFTTEWVKGAAYAYPSASEVIYDNTSHPTLTPTVQGAISDLDDGLAATTAIANTANSTATSALSIANAALPKAGGTMTGTIVSRNINVQNGFSVQFNGGVNGSQDGISDSVVLNSSTTAASSTALKSAYDLANAALPKSGGNMTGLISFAPGQVFPISGIQIASISQLGVVQVGTNINVTGAGVISVDSATTSTPGIVQLNDTTSSISVTEALTARAGKDLQDQINALTTASNVDLGGSIDCSTGFIDSVTAAGTAAGLVVGSPLPSPGAGNVDVYVIVTVGSASFNPPGGGGPYAPENGDWFLSNGTQWQYLGVGARPSYASQTTAGIVQLAYPADVQAGTNNTLAVTPAGLQSKVSDSTSTTSSTTIASSTAVKSAYDLANAALPKAGGTMTGDLTFSGAGVGVVFNDASTVEAISDSVATTSSTTAASSTAVKSAYDLANAALARSGGTMTGAITFAAGQVFPISGIQDATTGQKGVVQIGSNIQVSSGTISVNTATTSQLGVVQVGTNIDVSSGTISVKSASITQSGIVQLNDTTTSTSTTQALTANQGYQLQQQINALATSNNLTFAGTIDGSTGLMATVTVEGASVGFIVGSVLPTPSAAIDEYFVIVSVAGTMTPPGGVSTQVYVGDWWLASSITWTYIAAGFQPPYASTATPGLVRLSTNVETQAGTDATEAVTPASLQSKVSDSTSTTSSTCIASSTAVKSAYDLANAAVPKSIYSALGVIVAGTGASTIGGLSLGTCGQFLAANPACSTGLVWCDISLACVPCAAYTAVGDILVGTGAATYSALPLGTSGQALVVDTACTSGVKWVTATGLNLAGFTCSATPFNTALGSLAGAAFTTKSVANTAIGYAALDAETSGDFNVAIGHNALTAQNGATGNVAIGANAGAAVTSGSSNVVIGQSAGAAITSGTNNTFIGTCAGDLLTNGNFNTALGSAALGAQTGGNNNTAIGANAGDSVTTGADNTFVGQSAGNGVTTASGITAVGYLAGRNAAAGTTAVGCRALQIATGANNTAVGWNTGACLTTGANNTIVGYCALDAATSGNDNVAVGFAALTAVTTGCTNTAVGSLAAQSLTTGLDNVAVGYGALVNSGTASCNVAIGRSTLTVAAGGGNTAVGHRAGLNVSSGSVTAVGSNALTSVTTGTANTALGFSAGCSYTGSRSVFIGHGAGDAATTGNSHIFIGADAGGAVTLGIRNILIGDTAGDAITTGSNNTIIGDIAGSAALADNLILAAGTTIKLQVNENGAVGVGPTPSYGTSGQILSSTGTGGAAAWTSSLPQVTAPTASTDAGVQGQIASDATYFYMYTGGRWQRVAWDATVW